MLKKIFVSLNITVKIIILKEKPQKRLDYGRH